MKSLIYTLTIVLLFSISSCKKIIEVDAPIDRISSGSVFLEDGTALSAVLGLYSSLASQTPTFSDGAATIWMGLAADELNYTSTDAEIIAFNTNMLTSSNSLVYRDFWRNPYEIIYQANACIEGLERSASLTSLLKKQLTGEALFVRAFCYWYLVNLFSDVPLILNTNYEHNSLIPRTPAQNIMDQIILDLQTARGLLSINYPSDGKLRVNYYTATALLSRVYLYRKNWQAAEEVATEIISSGKYSLETDLSKTFLIGSNEALWQIAQPENSLFNTIEGSRLAVSLAGTAIPAYTISPSLNSSFEIGDKRKTSWTATKIVGGVTYNFSYKYKVRFSTAAKTEYCIAFRLAEMYLTRAEARAHLNNLAEAAADLNLIRNKAGLTDFVGTDMNAVLGAVLKEKRVECFAEYGQRWFDLKRTGQLDKILSNIKSAWIPNAALLPIPITELNLNINLNQNPGY
ncbi:RagB/SusD family nutrient uptake outer membrane protein [Chryseobacterium sp. ISL-6]|uniref:RagB/SusD family nutrient uptake outer membrane protein n=1 Tax=Chryseobacterium sp. ISL-6 TaxID=2819143 RepID=UPI001BE9AEFA|nr:RagB/SusD family nutrient uptake outer membrane protein [Chryseobacterium sp. ISL-6]MBT2621929.1 RagB/SusD family nutrient uptake outer membrane protein [Chryseobacterium sp. ISL-6]